MKVVKILWLLPEQGLKTLQAARECLQAARDRLVDSAVRVGLSPACQPV